MKNICSPQNLVKGYPPPHRAGTLLVMYESDNTCDYMKVGSNGIEIDLGFVSRQGKKEKGLEFSRVGLGFGSKELLMSSN